MINTGIPRLCGGTFFVLVLQAIRQRVKAREHYEGERDGLSDPEVLIGLIKVINPDYEIPSGGPEALKGKTNDFKSCKTSKGQYLPFGNTVEVEEFDARVREDYPTALSAMTEFVNRFLDLSPSLHKDVRLVKALIDLIRQDESIEPDDGFYVGEGGEVIKKKDMDEHFDHVCYPAFLLGVWHFVVVQRKTNRVGEDTYNLWCPENGGGPRKYSGKMGRSLTWEIHVYMPETTFANEKAEDDAETQSGAGNEEKTSGPEEKKDGSDQTPPPMQQVMNNPMFIQQNGDGNFVMPNYGTINLTLGGTKRD